MSALLAIATVLVATALVVLAVGWWYWRGVVAERPNPPGWQLTGLAGLVLAAEALIVGFVGHPAVTTGFAIGAGLVVLAFIAGGVAAQTNPSDW